MLDSLRPFVIPALSAKGQKLAFVTHGPFSCRRRRRRHGRGAGRHKSGKPCMGAGSNAQAWAGRGTGTQIIRTGTVFQCAPTAADPAAAVRGELTEVGAEREVQRAVDRRHCSQAFHRARWLKFCWLAMGAVCRISTLGKNLLAGDVRSAPLFFYTASRPQSQTGSSQFFVRRCAPRAAVFLYSKRGSRCMAENFYQLALRTPGIWPLYASSRKQIRQMP